MTSFKNLLLAFTVLSASTAAFASDDNFANLTLGKTNEKVKKTLALSSSTIDAGVSHGSAWGARLSQQSSPTGYCASYDNVSVSHNGIKLRQEELLGRYDLSYSMQG